MPIDSDLHMLPNVDDVIYCACLCVCLGIANLLSSFVSAYPVTASFSRQVLSRLLNKLVR